MTRFIKVFQFLISYVQHFSEETSNNCVKMQVTFHNMHDVYIHLLLHIVVLYNSLAHQCCK